MSKIVCAMTLSFGNFDQPKFLRIDWAWKESFNDFLTQAIRDHPDVIGISLDWGGDEYSLCQGDLHYGTWEKHDGLWNRIWHEIDFDASLGYKRVVEPAVFLDEIQKLVS